MHVKQRLKNFQEKRKEGENNRERGRRGKYSRKRGGRGQEALSGHGESRQMKKLCGQEEKKRKKKRREGERWEGRVMGEKGRWQRPREQRLTQEHLRNPYSGLSSYWVNSEIDRTC